MSDQKFKLQIADEFPVDVRLRMYGQIVPLTLVARRLDQAALDDWTVQLEDGDHAADKARKLLHSVVIGWPGQEIVVDDNGPVAFSAAAFDYLLDQSGVLDALLSAYARACRATLTDEGRRKNSVS